MKLKLSIFLFSLLGLAACREQFVDYPLPYEGPRLIPRVTITDGTCRVSLARTIPPDGSWAGSVLVSGATIKLFRDDSLLFTLSETSPGQYQRSMSGNMREGSVYTLTVFADGYPEVFCGPVRAPGKATLWGLAQIDRDSMISTYNIWHDNPAGIQFFEWTIQARPIDDTYKIYVFSEPQIAEYCAWLDMYEEACILPDTQQVKVLFSVMNSIIVPDSNNNMIIKPVFKAKASLRVYANECLRDYKDPQDDMSSHLITNGYGRFVLYRASADSILVNP